MATGKDRSTGIRVLEGFLYGFIAHKTTLIVNILCTK